MPVYEYACPANGRVVEVRHKMGEELKTWGELCERAGMERGRTDAAAAVQKLMSAGFIGSTGNSAPECASGPCGSGPCAGGACSLQ